MTFESWAVFVPAAFALSLYPGPNNLLALSHGARFGTATALVAAAGRFPPFALFVLGAAIGLGTLITTSATLFTAFKILGAAYLVWLGWRMLRAGDGLDGTLEAGPGARLPALLRREFLTAITNPKAMLVFTAFLAPFVDPSEPAFGQFVLLGAAALVLEVAAVVIYAVAGERLGGFARSRGLLGAVNKASGGLLIAAGALLAVASRPAAS